MNFFSFRLIFKVCLFNLLYSFKHLFKNLLKYILELSFTLTSRLSNREIKFTNDPTRLSSINPNAKATFMEQQKWYIYFKF